MGLFQPLVQAINEIRLIRTAKNLRNAIVDRSFRVSGRGERARFLASFEPTSEIVVFSIAYNTPWVVDLLTEAWRRHVRDADLVIVDNSDNRAARAALRQICDQRGIAYLALPKNYEWSPLRSNAISMNWVYYNIVLRLTALPRYFGFIDHDCFPIAGVSFQDLLQGNAVYGLKRVSERLPAKWYLWAGFCFFQPSLITSKSFDFKHSYEHRMDTGGRNWWPVYSTLPPEQCGDAGFRVDVIKSDGLTFHEQIIGGMFSHIGGASYRADFSSERVRLAYQIYIKQKYFDHI